MAPAVELATGYVSLVTSTSKLGKQITRDFGGIGTQSGRQFGKGFEDDTAKSGKGAGSKLGAGLLSGVKGIAGPIAALFAVDKVFDFFKSANAEAREAQKVGARTTNVIKTTGGAANVTAGAVGKLSEAISKKTGVDDEAIQSGANVVLTFTKIRNEAGKGNDIFDRTTTAANDMAVALGKSNPAAARILGKALNDPIKGMSALSRVGITFTDSQKKQVEQMVKSGNVLGAQKLILSQVEERYKGAAAAGATAGDKLRVSWDNFKEQVGTALLPVIDRLAIFLTERVIPAASRLATFLSTNVGPAFERVRGFVSGLLGAFQSLGGGEGGGAVAFIRPVAGALGGLVAAGQRLAAVVLPIVRQIAAAFLSQWPAIKPIVMGIFTTIKGTVVDAMGIIQKVISSVTTIVQLIWSRWGGHITKIVVTLFSTLVKLISGAMKIIGGIVKLVLGLITGDWGKARDGIKLIASGLKTIVVAIFKALATILKSTVGAMLSFIIGKFRDWDAAVTRTVRGWRDKAVSIVKDMATKVRTSISDMLSKVRDRFASGVDAIGRAWDRLKDKAKAPIKFVVETVINRGLIGAFNKIAGVIPGVGRLPNVSVGFAQGGWTGPGAKMQPAGIVHADEFVINKASRRRIEKDSPGLLNALNGYASGGLVGGAGRFTARFAAVLLMAQKLFGGRFSIFQRGFRPATSYSGTSHRGDAVDLGPATARVVAILRGLGVAAWRRGPGFPGGFSTRHIHGVPLPGRGNAGGSGVWQARNYLAGGDGLGGRDYEARGGIGGLLGKLGAFLKSGFTSLKDWFADLIKGPMGKLNSIKGSPLGQLAAGVPGLLVEGMKKKIDVFDSGGVLRPGLTLAYNGTGRDEYVSPPGGGLVIQGGVHGYSAQEVAVAIEKERRKREALQPSYA